MEKNINFAATQQLPWCADLQTSLILPNSSIAKVDPQADVRVIPSQLERRGPLPKDQNKIQPRKQAATSSYALQGKTLDVAEAVNFSNLPSMPFKDSKHKRNKARQSMHTMPVGELSQENKLLFTGQGTQKFRMVVLPPFGKNSNGPNEQKSKALWNKIQQNIVEETAQQSKRQTNVISHQKSFSALNNYKETREEFDVLNKKPQQIKSEYKQTKYVLRTDKNQVVDKKFVKPHGFLASVGGNKTYGANFSLPSNHILRNEILKAERADQISIYTGMNVDQKRKDLLLNGKINDALFFIDKDTTRKADEEISSKFQKANHKLDLDNHQLHLQKMQDSATKELRQAQDQNEKLPRAIDQKEKKLLKTNSRLKLTGNDVQKLAKEGNLAHPQTGVLTTKDPFLQIRLKQKINSLKLSEEEQKYPEIFDRAERTLAATFAKVGDLNYFTPFQRIGCFMEYTQRLKRKNLLDLIAYMKLSKISNRIEEEDDEKTDKDYQEQSLFHGLMLSEQVELRKLSVYQAENMPEIVSKLSKGLHNQVKAYNPCSAQSGSGFEVHKVWSNLLVQKLELSISRFIHYIESPDLIKASEVSQYRKDWMANALRLVPDILLSKNSEIVKAVFSEIFTGYQTAMKFAIMEYILLSPNERKRLNIMMLPKIVPTASDLQIENGGYSVVKFHGTNFRKQEAERLIRINLVNNNIVVSALLSWAQEFRQVRLVDFASIREVIRIQNQTNKKFQSQTIDVDNLFAFFEAYMDKGMSVLRNLWLRGAILIIKKFKLLRLSDSNGKQVWTFKGPAADNQPESSFKSVKDDQTPQMFHQYNICTSYVHQSVQLQGLQYVKDNRLDSLPSTQASLHENLSLDDLADIRQTPAYLRFIQNLGGKVNLAVNGYEKLDKQYKRELKHSAGNLMQSQLREIVDRSVLEFTNFFKSFPTYKQLQATGQLTPLRDLKSTVTKIKEPKKVALAQVQQKLIYFGKEAKNTLQEQTAVQDTPIPELRLPEFLNLQDFVNPILKIQLLLGSDRAETKHQDISNQLIFSRSTEQILEDFGIFFDSLVNCMNDVSRPEFCKIKVLSQKQYDRKQADAYEKRDGHKKEEEKDNKLLLNITQRTQQNFVTDALKEGIYQEDLSTLINPKILDYNVLMYSSILRDKQAYSKYFGRIQLEQSPDEVQVKKLYDLNQELEILSKNSYARVKVHRKYTVASNSEEVYRKLRHDLLKNISHHLRELNQVKLIFEQFQELIGGSLKSRVMIFVSDTTDAANKINEFKRFVKETHYYRNLVSQLPERVAFPLFEVGLYQVKRELKERVENILFILLYSFEQYLFQQSVVIVTTFKTFAQMLAKNIVTAQDVVDMEAYKNSMIVDMAQLQTMLTIQKRCFLFLISYNDQAKIFCEPIEENGQLVQGHCYRIVCQTLEWPAKIQQLIANAEDRHQVQRTTIENDVSQKRKVFDKEVIELQMQIKKQNTFSDLKNYSRAYGQLKDTKVQIDACKMMAEQLEIQEMQLFGNSQKNRNLQTICESFESNYLLWKTSHQLMSRINKWQGLPMYEINVLEVQKCLQSCGTNLERLKQVKPGMQESESILKVLTQLQREYEKIQSLFDLIKVLSSDLLQEVHWGKIKKLVGSESINLKKMNLSGIIALDLRSLTEEFNAILKQAEAFSVIEKQFKEIQNDWEKRRLETVNLDETTNLIFDDRQLIEFDALLQEHLQKLKNMADDTNSESITKQLRDWYFKLHSLHIFIQVVSGLQEKYIQGFAIITRLRQDLNTSGQDGFDIETYNQLDQLWQQTVARVQSDRYFINMIIRQDLMEKLQSMLESYEEKMKGFQTQQ